MYHPKPIDQKSNALTIKPRARCLAGLNREYGPWLIVNRTHSSRSASGVNHDNVGIVILPLLILAAVRRLAVLVGEPQVRVGRVSSVNDP
ncbi:unnamed protein product [Schistocephalus solidus]|uniref:Uncharacterized protein n=1 Tax=Schistocephalus solidus TaxID=70667 RepID=A0A183SZP0_SCHSO|nr:unnamed protein product [Schistocephalus solidus]